MTVTIVRHAIAVPRGTPGYPNDDRPLTEEGKEKMVKASRGIVRVIDAPDLILTSSLQRARDTAYIVAGAFESDVPVEITPLLLPNASPSSLFSLLSARPKEEHVMLVGHEPALGSIAGALLGAGPERMPFKKGGIACFDVRAFPPKPVSTLRWSLPPRILRLIA